MAVWKLFLWSLWFHQALSASYNSYPYLYSIEGDTNSSFPVVEFIAPDNDRERQKTLPDFLKSSANDYRVVEYYVHWCGICRHFRSYYVKLARKLLRMVPDTKISFYAISCVPNRVVCQKQKITGYPVLKVYPPGDNKGTLIKHTDVSALSVLNALTISTGGLHEPSDAEDWVVSSTTGPSELSWWSSLSNYMQDDTSKQGRRTREDLMNDVHLSFDFAMRNSIYMEDGEDKLSREAKRTLKSWLRLVRKTLPPSWVQLHNLLEKLTRNYGYVSKKEGYLLTILDKYPPPRQEWSPSCSMGEPGRGYTCGLWELFHTVTVGVVNYNKNQVDERKLLPTEIVARTIRNYIKHFFQCNECREKFLAAFDNCAHDRCNVLKTIAKLGAKDETNYLQIQEWEALPLWLFQVHNAVNERLLKERAKREFRQLALKEIQASQWPPISECSSCWTGDWDRKHWDAPVVTKFLQLEYGVKDESLIEFQKTINAENAKASLNNSKSGSGNVTLHMVVFFVCAVAYCFLDGRTTRLFQIRKLRTL